MTASWIQFSSGLVDARITSFADGPLQKQVAYLLHSKEFAISAVGLRQVDHQLGKLEVIDGLSFAIPDRLYLLAESGIAVAKELQDLDLIARRTACGIYVLLEPFVRWGC